MMRVFLADDNRLVRESLIRSIDWKAEGLEIVGEAENGPAALQGILRELPDILILDIRMPGKTGLEVLEEVRKREIPCECIIVSGYDEFAYARQGLRLGVMDFLIKPVDNQELLDVLKRAAKAVRERKEKKQAEAIPENGRSSAAGAGKSCLTGDSVLCRLFYEGLEGDRDAAGRLEEELRHVCRFNYCELMLVCLPQEKGKDKEQRRNLETELFGTLERNPRYHFLRTWTREGLATLILFSNVQFEKDYDVDAVRIANDVFRRGRALGVELNVGISGHTKNLSELSELYEQAVYAQNSRFFFENHDVMHYATVKSQGIKNGYSLGRELDEFYRAMMVEPEQSPVSIRKIGILIGENASYEVDYIKNILIHIGLVMSGFMQKIGGQSNECELWEIVQNIRESQNIGEALEWLENYAGELIDRRKQQENSRFSPMTSKIMDYLKDYYSEKISLQEVADYMGVSVSHICRVLKNDTGETFTTLLNKIRIREAMRMLRNGEYRVYEIAERVGFGNYAYFYQLFKKETGSSPTEFVSDTPQGGMNIQG